jgi:ketosteroid isomerase-like protein
MPTPLETVRGFYADLARADLPGVLSRLDPAIEWTEAERFPYFDGTWRGPAAIVAGLFEPLARDWIAFAAEAYDFVCDGEEVVAFGRYTGVHRASGRSLDAPFAHRWRVSCGRVVRFVQHTDTAKVLEATLGPPPTGADRPAA